MQLICIFTILPELHHTVGMIKDSYIIAYNRIYVLSIVDSEELVCSFNIDKNSRYSVLPSAMTVHRKKETNTLYTINSLNALIKSENNGILDTNYMVDWNKFTNSFLITSNNGLKILKTKVHQVINTN
jgi:hypothetical protein